MAKRQSYAQVSRELGVLASIVIARERQPKPDQPLEELFQRAVETWANEYNALFDDFDEHLEIGSGWARYWVLLRHCDIESLYDLLQTDEALDRLSGYVTRMVELNHDVIRQLVAWGPESDKTIAEVHRQVTERFPSPKLVPPVPTTNLAGLSNALDLTAAQVVTLAAMMSDIGLWVQGRNYDLRVT
jgi:hypothetical protein